MLASCAAAISIGQYFVIQKYFKPSDDTLYIYYNSMHDLRADDMRATDVMVLGEYAKLGARPNLVLRYEMRRDYRNNYSILRKSLSHYVEQYQLANGKLSDSVSALMARAYMQAYVTASLIAMLVLLAAVALCGDARLYFATTLGCALILLLDGEILADLFAFLTGHQLTPGHISMVRASDGITNLFLLMFNPRPGARTLTFLPSIGLLLLGVFVLRWSGRYRLAYLFAIVIAAFHQSMATIMLAWLIAIDLVQRPSIFKDVRLLAIIGVGVAMALMRERIWHVIGAEHLFLLLAGLVVVAAGAAWIWRQGRFQDAVMRVRTAWSNRPVIFQPEATLKSRIQGDLIVSAILWCITIIYPYVLNKFIDGPIMDYFWSHAHGRILSALRPAIFVGLILLIVLEYERRRGEIALWRKAVLAVGAVALVLAPVLHKVAQEPDASQRITTALNAIDKRIAPLKEIEGPEEEVIYFAIAKQMATGQPALRILFPNAGREPR